VALPEFLASQGLAFVLGVLASWAFWYILLHLAPSLKIAPQAVYDVSSERIEIKVANFGVRQITDIEAYFVLSDRVPEGRLVPVRRGQLDPANILALEEKGKVNMAWCLPTTYIFVCTNGKELRELLALASASSGERRLVFTISARDAVSGTKRVQRVTYPASALIDGSYARGLTFSVVPSPAPHVETDAEHVS
jgi:hypothetical protein